MGASSESHGHGLGGEARQIEQELENSMKSTAMEETQGAVPGMLPEGSGQVRSPVIWDELLSSTSVPITVTSTFC